MLIQRGLAPQGPPWRVQSQDKFKIMIFWTTLDPPPRGHLWGPIFFWLHILILLLKPVLYITPLFSYDNFQNVCILG